MISRKYASYLYDFPDLHEGCTNQFANNFDPTAVVDDGSCEFTDNSQRIILAEITPQLIEAHGVYVREAVNQGYGSSLTDSIDLLAMTGYEAYLKSSVTHYKAYVYSYEGLMGLIPYLRTIYPTTQAFMPLGSNSFILISDVTSIPEVITCGAGATHNITGYGPGLEFWDNENIGSVAIQSSLSNGIIAGKILKIRDTLDCSFWEARYRARITATRTESRRPPNTYWTQEDGFGQINVTAAIDFVGSIPADPYLNSGNVYLPFIP